MLNYLSVVVEEAYQLMLSLTFSMPPPKPQTKDLEEILQSIQECMSCIQEDNHTQQAAMETHNDFVQSTLTFLMNQIPSTHTDENTNHPLTTPNIIATPLPLSGHPNSS